MNFNNERENNFYYLVLAFNSDGKHQTLKTETIYCGECYNPQAASVL